MFPNVFLPLVYQRYNN